jgi:hypothetical protein
MATANDVVKSALRLLGVIGAAEAPSADMAQDGLEALNDLMHAFAANGIDWTHQTLALADPVQLDAKHIRGLKYLLAQALAPEYERTLSPEAQLLADQGYRALQADFSSEDEAEIDSALLFMPSRRWGL